MAINSKCISSGWRTEDFSFPTFHEIQWMICSRKMPQVKFHMIDRSLIKNKKLFHSPASLRNSWETLAMLAFLCFSLVHWLNFSDSHNSLKYSKGHFIPPRHLGVYSFISILRGIYHIISNYSYFMILFSSVVANYFKKGGNAWELWAWILSYKYGRGNGSDYRLLFCL